ncbi:CPBP family intramembrane metalloprotease [Spiractinospora alimapuensis]|uniref:CPBP family intramembrane glutamic endopeptidase n=1 Tax=Spiractinospora alimapuensis TaxID=2820884 RepID=UPI001F47F346|nr:CPBP family intramembrane glutamic endopeptidase [Spiractinospora alimapuensis]QVQ53386.1 CPBP family intramembrane metalloprotease [Spiractinospora alimapuensis]
MTSRSSALASTAPVGAFKAYAILMGLYVLVFGPSIASQVVMMVRDGRIAATAPNPDQLWFVVGMTWAMDFLLVAFAGIALWVTARTCRIKVTDIFTPATRRSWWQSLGVFFSVLAAYITGMGARARLESTMATTDVGIIMNSADEALRMVLLVAVGQFTSAFVEETVAVACVVLLLTAASRPTWEVAIVLVIAKALYHAYYGWPILIMAPVTLLTAWMYWRTGRLWPIITAHAVYNGLFTAVVITTIITAPDAF